jgi:hypothetical protein
MSQLTGGFYAAPLSRKHQNELEPVIANMPQGQLDCALSWQEALATEGAAGGV